MIRYPGSKRAIAPKLVDLFPYHREYRELFAGGNSILPFHNPWVEKWINDIDPFLVNYYLCLRDDPSFVDSIFSLRESLYDADKLATFFYRARKEYDRLRNITTLDELLSVVPDRSRLALNYLFLRRLSFEGMVGSHRRNIASIDRRRLVDVFRLTPKRIEQEKESLTDCKITCGDWKLLLEDVSEDTFLFLDPPYMTGQPWYSHTLDMEEHFYLAERLRTIGCNWMLTLQKSQSAIELYRAFNIIPRRCEIIVRNY